MTILDDASYYASCLRCHMKINKASKLHRNLGKDHWFSHRHGSHIPREHPYISDVLRY